MLTKEEREEKLKEIKEIMERGKGELPYPIGKFNNKKELIKSKDVIYLTSYRRIQGKGLFIEFKLGNYVVFSKVSPVKLYAYFNRQISFKDVILQYSELYILNNKKLLRIEDMFLFGIIKDIERTDFLDLNNEIYIDNSY